MEDIPHDIEVMLLARNTSLEAVENVLNSIKRRNNDKFKFSRGTLGIYDNEIYALCSSYFVNGVYIGNAYDDFAAYIGRFGMNGELKSDEEFVTKREYGERIRGSGLLSFYGVGLPFLLNNLRSSVKSRAEKTEKFFKVKRKIKEDNLEQLKNLAGPVKIYPGSIDEVKKTLKRGLEMIGAGEPVESNWSYDNLYLRAKSALLGAELIVNYQPGGYPSGIPIKYSDKEPGYQFELF